MVVEAVETPNGWPLGLGNVNLRLRAAEPYAIQLPSPSFSSFSSSNLDTESTASFFQDQSVSLGRLIGIRPGNRGSLHHYYSSTIQLRRSLSTQRSHSDVSRTAHIGHEVEQTSQGLCVPLFHNVIVKMSRSKSSSRH